MSTPATAVHSISKRSTSATRNKPPSRPSTPLRPSSRTSLRNSQSFTPNASGTYSSAFPLEVLEPAFAELSDSMADLEANFMHLQLMNESLQRFNESFAGFLYGLNMNAFCVDFPEQPIPESFKRAHQTNTNQDLSSSTNLSTSQSPQRPQPKPDPGDETFITSDTSFVTNTPASRLPTTKFKDAAPVQGAGRPPTGQAGRDRVSSAGTRVDRGGVESGVGRGGAPAGRGMTRGSGIARGKLRGTMR